MPIERINLRVPDEPLKDLITWLPRDGGKEEFQQLHNYRNRADHLHPPIESIHSRYHDTD